MRDPRLTNTSNDDITEVLFFYDSGLCDKLIFVNFIDEISIAKGIPSEPKTSGGICPSTRTSAGHPSEWLYGRK